MAHIHNVIDTDVHYKIDGVTRTITNVNETKRRLVQYDHNSERLTFEVPRFVDNHDLSECNAVQIHFVNKDVYEKNVSKSFYMVNDLHVKDDDEETVELSWLVANDATQFVGTLDFVIRFACVRNDVIDYVWNTAIFEGITILPGIYNILGEVTEEQRDIIAKIQSDIADIKKIQEAGAPLWSEIKGKPSRVEEETIVILPETTYKLNVTNGVGVRGLVEPTKLGLEVGMDYDVIWNGVYYRCTAIEVILDNGNKQVVIGAQNEYGAVEGEEPFYIEDYDIPVAGINMTGAIYDLEGNSQVTLSITTVKITEKFDNELLDLSWLPIVQETRETFLDKTISFTSNIKECDKINLKEEVKYIVTWQNVDYETTAVATTHVDNDGNEIKYTCIGGYKITEDNYPASDFSQIPFYIAWIKNLTSGAEEFYIMKESNISEDISIAIKESVINVDTMPKKFLPNGVATVYYAIAEDMNNEPNEDGETNLYLYKDADCLFKVSSAELIEAAFGNVSVAICHEGTLVSVLYPSVFINTGKHCSLIVSGGGINLFFNSKEYVM